MSNWTTVLDTAGLAVVTGGASGFGYETSTRLLKAGMAVAILDISVKELANAQKSLGEIAAANNTKVHGIQCNVTKKSNCINAANEIAKHFPNKQISFLFNNAGINGNATGGILQSDTEAWKGIFAVNVYGAVNILQVFTDIIVKQGKLASGKNAHVVTTSSVVGLLNHNPGGYSVSKMAATAVCEQYAIELSEMGDKAKHIVPHSLHPTAAATNFMTRRTADGNKTSGDEFKNFIKGNGGSTAIDIVDGLFNGLAGGEYYIIVDNPNDVPTRKQIENRMADQIKNMKPRKAEQIASIMNRPVETNTLVKATTSGCMSNL